MAHTPKSTDFADEYILDVMADPDAQADGLAKLAELARNASPETRARLEHTMALVAHCRQIRSMALITLQQIEEELMPVEQEPLSIDVHGLGGENLSAAE